MKIDNGIIYFERLTEANPSKRAGEINEPQFICADAAQVESFEHSNAPGVFRQPASVEEVFQAFMVMGKAASELRP